jgi:LL-diaminopimelate aminotransferase
MTNGGLLFQRADRLLRLEDYLFSFIDGTRELADDAGLDVIPLAVGDCDLPTPPHIVEALRRAVLEPVNHSYPPYVGKYSMLEAASSFMARRFGVAADPSTEVLVTMGSKEAMAHLALGYVGPGDVVLVPDPAYPVYETWAKFCGAEVYRVPLREENGFLPDLRLIPSSIAARAKIFWICYPNNPTTALASADFFSELARFAIRHNIIVASDAAYSEIYYDTAPPPSFLAAPGAMECGIEFHSLSKTYNMAGWRVGFAAGNRDIIGALRAVKTNTDSGTFAAVQDAAVAALGDHTEYPDELRATYRSRIHLLCEGLRTAGLDVLQPSATFYCLVRNPEGYTSAGFAKRLLEDARVLSIPASGFGPGGEGYVRISVCAGTELINEAVRRIAGVSW